MGLDEAFPDRAARDSAAPDTAARQRAAGGEAAQGRAAPGETAQGRAAQGRAARYDITAVVRDAVAATLGASDLPADLDVTLVDDLGLESLDLLDILFRIENQLPVRLSIGWLSEVLQGDVSDVEFCTENGVITDRGLERLREFMPQLEPARWSGRLRVEHVPALVTVANLVDLVRIRVGMDEATSLV